MVKYKELVVTKSEQSDDIDVTFAASDDNLDLIVRELDLVTEFLENEEKKQRGLRYKTENRERINQRQREWFKAHPEKVREYNERRDKDTERQRARELYQVNREKERERQRIIREKRRAAKQNTQVIEASGVAVKMNQGVKNVIEHKSDKSPNIGNVINSMGDMEL